jgi:hypothetical protein
MNNGENTITSSLDDSSHKNYDAKAIVKSTRVKKMLP